MTFAPLASGVDRLAIVAAERPDHLALVDDRPDGSRRALTLPAFNAYVNRIANALLGLGFQPGERLLWAGRNSVEVMAVQHAARKVGGYSVPLNHRLQSHEVHEIAKISEATVAWGEAGFREIFDKAQLPKLRDVVIFEGDPAPGQLSLDAFLEGGSEEEPPPRDASQRAFDPILSFTGGTTGRPKGVVRRTLGAAETVIMSKLLGGGEGAFIVTGSLSHSGPNGMANNVLLLGGTVVLQRRFEGEDWLRLVETYRVTNTYSAPYPMRVVCNLPEAVRERYDASSLRTIMAAAAYWPFDLKQQFLRTFPNCDVWEVYGSTELGSVAILGPEDQLRKPGSCGKIVEGVECQLIGEDGDRVREPGKPGVLYAKSDSVFTNYLGDDDATVDAFRGEYATSGDIAYYDDEGYFYIVDRVKDMVVSGGVNIYPREVENALERHPQVFESAVIGLPDEAWGEKLLAVVVALVEGEGLDAEQLEAFCREQLAIHKVPREYVFVDELPHLLSGKVNKRELAARFLPKT